MIAAESNSAIPKIRARFTLLIALAILAAGCSPKATPKLIVGMELAYPPFEMTDPQGRATGVSVDLARAFGKFLGQEIQIQNLPFDGLIPSLQTRKIDLIISSLTATPERAKSIDFSEPYLKTGLCLLVGKKSPIQSIEDMDQPGRTLAVKLGTTRHAYARQKINRASVLVLDQMSVFKSWQRHPYTTRPLLKPFQTESWAIGIRKGNPELVQKVNAFLKEFRARGGFDELGDRYLQEQKQAFRQMGIPFYF